MHQCTNYTIKSIVINFSHNWLCCLFVSVVVQKVLHRTATGLLVCLDKELVPLKPFLWARFRTRPVSDFNWVLYPVIQLSISHPSGGLVESTRIRQWPAVRKCWISWQIPEFADKCFLYDVISAVIELFSIFISNYDDLQELGWRELLLIAICAIWYHMFDG